MVNKNAEYQRKYRLLHPEQNRINNKIYIENYRLKNTEKHQIYNRLASKRTYQWKKITLPFGRIDLSLFQ